MSTSELRSIIQSIGLESHEAELYLIGLKLGWAPASAYAKATKQNRITTYNYLENLVQRGVFHATQKGRAMTYAPITPDQLSIEARKNVEALEKAMPDLQSLMGNYHRIPHVRYFEGMQGIRKVYRDILTTKDTLLNFASPRMIQEYWKEYNEEYVRHRVKKGIFLKGIAPDDAMGKKVQGKGKKNLSEIRLVNAKEFPMHNVINIYDNKVAIISFSEEETDIFGVIIESKEVADTQRQIFEMAWRFAQLGESARTKKMTNAEAEDVREDQLNMF